MYDNYPSDIRQYDTHPLSPFYEEQEPIHCPECGEIMAECTSFLECIECGYVINLGVD